jgi:MoCo/4Fe-4S cofactor protein with predicted Tat translocation signal
MNLKSQISNLNSTAGRRYWRSLDEVAETPEFRQWLEREFPEGATEWSDPVSRRHFVKIMSASFMLAGVGLAAGCRRPVEKLEPFGKQPDDYVFGTSQYFATARPTRGGAVPLVAVPSRSRATRCSPAATAAPTAGPRLRSSTSTIPTARGASPRAATTSRPKPRLIS